MSSALKILDREHPYIPTDKGLNYIIAQEFKEIFIDVFEINCGNNKIIAEKVDSINGDPVIKVDTQVSGKVYSTLFVLREGENNIILNTKSLSNGRNMLEKEKAVVDGIISEFYQPTVSDVSREKTAAIGALHESYADKKHKIDQFRQSITELIDERISQIQESSAESINSAKNNLTNLVEESINANRIDRDSTLAEINSIRENILTTVELYSDTISQTAEEKTTQLRDLQEKVNFEVSTKLAELDVETKSQLRHISEAYDSIKAFITTTKEEFLNQKTSSYNNLEKLHTKANQIVSENLKRAESLVGKKIIQLQATADKKINDLTSVVESRINTFDGRVKDINDALKHAGDTLTETINEAIKDLEYKSQESALKFDIEIQDRINTLDKTKSDVTSLVESKIDTFNNKIKDIDGVLERAENTLTKTINEAVKELECKSQENALKLDTEIQNKIDILDKTKSDITTIAENQVVKLESKIKDVENITNKVEKSLAATTAEVVAKLQVEATTQVNELDKTKNQLAIVAKQSLSDIKQVAVNLTEAVEKKVRDVTLVAVKKEDLAQLKKQLEARLDNESSALKKYVAGYGGGGSVAQQFAAGGNINGTLNVASGQILSAGVDLFNILGGGGGGGGSQTLSFSASNGNLAISNGNTVSLSAFSVLSAADLLTTTIDFAPLATPPTHADGRIYYDTTEHTLVFMDGDPTITYPINKLLWIIGVNKTGSVIPKGTVVYLSGAQGNRGQMWPAQATSDLRSADTIGITMGSTAINQEGYIMAMGELQGIDTRAYPDGTTLYLSPTAAGGITSVKPQAPNHIVKVGFSLNSTVNGKIYVEIDNGYELDELHNVRINGVSNGQGLVYNSTSALWVNSDLYNGSDLKALSANWQNTYSTVQANSAQWAVDSTTDTGVRSLTGNWQNTYTNFSTQSANNASVYSTVQTYSAAWTDTAAPTTLTYAASVTPSLSDGISRKVTMTGDLTLNAPTNATDGSLWKGRFTASGADRTITLGANIQTPRGTTFSGIVSSGFTRLFEMNYNGTKWWLVRNQEFTA